MTTVILGPVGIQRQQRSSSHHSRRAWSSCWCCVTSACPVRMSQTAMGIITCGWLNPSPNSQAEHFHITKCISSKLRPISCIASILVSHEGDRYFPTTAHHDEHMKETAWSKGHLPSHRPNFTGFTFLHFLSAKIPACICIPKSSFPLSGFLHNEEFFPKRWIFYRVGSQDHLSRFWVLCLEGGVAPPSVLGGVALHHQHPSTVVPKWPTPQGQRLSQI